MTRLVVGIDTGGTYTDAVVVDAGARRVLAKAKALTTKGDLAIGVREALDRVLAAAGERRPGGLEGRDIALVSLSTTLATNAIVEGHGSPVAAILIGFDDAMAERTDIARALPGTRIGRFAGGHDHGGGEAARLDVAELEAFVRETASQVGAYAVASQWSVRNPGHERQARAIVERIAGRPATLSSELAHALDAPRRALTAALNARIIGAITALIGAVRAAMARHGVAAPLMVVKGDGTLAPAEAVALRPIETILSGPSASVIGAKFLSGLSDFVISDVGGTTTDVAVLENGWPRLDREGAQVGGRRTLVRAIAMRTFGLGGDSEVLVDARNRVGLSSGKVVPLSLLAHRHPDVLRRLQAQLNDPEGAPYAGKFLLRPFGQAGADPGESAARERDILAAVNKGPAPMGDVIHGPLQQKALARLVGAGRIAVAGFTPSDAAHVLGLQGQWSAEGARVGALVLERRLRMAGPLGPAEADAAARRFAAEVFDATAAKSARVIVEALAGEALDGDAAGLVDAVASGQGRWRNLRVAIGPVAPVVAVGGPAPVFYPEVGRRLGSEVVLPPHGDVANAVGAAVGVVKAQAVVDISSSGVGAYRIHAEGEPVAMSDPTEALARARDIAVEAARARALAMGGSAPEVDVHVDRVDLPGMEGDRGLVAATVVAECWGTPLAE
ncbi:hydantoinase [Alsobacter metallidurans]|uniref:Hydantoinase n=1 Tax=Alsobacter metallidurans TaxID=340221 RepID=A0A917IAW5_9HYPH|nr:hydantoinase/oxoprolinase family protein [Alsobacter metallidurans]GGH29053.1 hydantoinase [Alsobacter metallidurans]